MKYGLSGVLCAFAASLWFSAAVPAIAQQAADVAEVEKLMAQAEPIVEALSSDRCGTALANWRGFMAQSDTNWRIGAMGAAFEYRRHDDWPKCLSGKEDRLEVVFALIEIALEPGPQQVIGGELLKPLVVDDWLDRLAQTGDLQLLIQAAEIHVFCAPVGRYPSFTEPLGSHAETVEKTCDRLTRVGAPDLRRGLMFYAVALQDDDWTKVSRMGDFRSWIQLFSTPPPANVAIENPFDVLNRLGISSSDPRAMGIFFRGQVFAALENYAQRGGAELWEQAHRDAEDFRAKPVECLLK